ncbi:MAG: AEC family transporter [Clostridia bacterium]|nr:AEC family transporter [Clostridia bacterium]
MGIVFEQVLILFIFVTIGFVLGRTKLVNSEHSQMLSKLLVYVFLPCNNIKAFSSNCTPKYLSENYVLVIIGFIVLFILMLVIHFLAKPLTKNKYDRYVYEYSMIMPNYGFMGYALAESFFGEVGLLNFIMFSLAFAVYIYTIAFTKLTKSGFAPKKLVTNPALVSIAIGLVLGLTQLPIPSVIQSVLSKGSVCMAPVSMVLAGLVISEFNLKEIVKRWEIYPVTFVRLLGVPILAGIILKLLGANETILQTVVLFAALPCGMNTIVFPKLVNEDCRAGAGLALVSTVLACATIPVVMSYIFNLV